MGAAVRGGGRATIVRRLFRQAPSGPQREAGQGATPSMDPTTAFANLREAERYRDSLPPGSAERTGAEEMVTTARDAFERALPRLDDRAPRDPPDGPG